MRVDTRRGVGVDVDEVHVAISAIGRRVGLAWAWPTRALGDLEKKIVAGSTFSSPDPLSTTKTRPLGGLGRRGKCGQSSLK